MLSTVKLVLGPAAEARFPAVSLAVDAAILIPSVPSPVIPEILTVIVVVPDPVTATVPVALPVASRVMFEFSRVTASAPV